MRKGTKTYGLYGIKNINLSTDLIIRKDLKYSDVIYFKVKELELCKCIMTIIQL